MKFTYCVLILFLARKLTAASVKKPPAYAAPLYSNSFLPATLQVIFHAVEQLRYLQIEEALQENTTSLVPTTSSHRPGQHHPYSSSDAEEGSQTESMAIISDDKIYDKSFGFDEVTPIVNYETPEQNHETPEINHVTPEINYEKSEITNESQSNTKVINDKSMTSPSEKSNIIATTKDDATTPKLETEKKKATVDSIVQDVYDIMKPIKSNVRFAVGSTEKSDELDEEDEEIRFTLLGEKVTQVPRPSLSSSLKRDKVPLKASLEQLALLYDALNKDARKQGFAKYAGYSDTILKALESSAGGGAGEQLKTLLAKTVDGNELTRDDSKTKAREAQRDLLNPASNLSTDLRRLLPLHYIS